MHDCKLSCGKMLKDAELGVYVCYELGEEGVCVCVYLTLWCKLSKGHPL